MTTPGATGCKPLTATLNGIGEPAFSSDGRRLYVPGRTSDTVVMLEREPSTGALSVRACLSFAAGVAGCTPVNNKALDGAVGTTLSNGTLYVTGGTGSAIGWFPLDGAGVPQANGSGCLAATAGGGCGTGAGLVDAATVTVAHDGKFVYVASIISNAIAVFARNGDGSLDQSTVTPKCFHAADKTPDCDSVPALNWPRDIEVSTDDSQVLVSSATCITDSCASLIAFDRDRFGRLAGVHEGIKGCITANKDNEGCTYAPFDADQITQTPDGRQIYMPGRNQHTLGVIDRDPVTGDLTPRPACARGAAGPPSCAVSAPRIDSPFDVALSPSGDAIYLADLGGRVDVLDRAANGSFLPKAAPFECIGVSCPSPLSPSGPVEYTVPSPDGRHVYAMWGDRIWTLFVDRAPVCTSFPVNVPFNTTVPITLRCTDADGEALTNFRIVTAPARGLPILQGDTVNYGPLVGTTGADSFTYTVTAGGADADPATVSITVGDPPPATCRDADRDGFCAGQDCDDASAAVRPGAREVLGNRVDENCDGLAEPFPLLTTPVNGNWSVKGVNFTLKSLLLRTPLPKGLSAEIRCTGKSCPFKVRKLQGKSKKGTLDAYKSLGKKVRFRAGQTLEVRISAPGFNTKVYRIPLKKGKLPIGTTLCLPPDVKTPQRRCT